MVRFTYHLAAVTAKEPDITHLRFVVQTVFRVTIPRAGVALHVMERAWNINNAEFVLAVELLKKSAQRVTC